LILFTDSLGVGKGGKLLACRSGRRERPGARHRDPANLPGRRRRCSASRPYGDLAPRPSMLGGASNWRRLTFGFGRSRVLCYKNCSTATATSSTAGQGRLTKGVSISTLPGT